jgi:hypothetical protein
VIATATVQAMLTAVAASPARPATEITA